MKLSIGNYMTDQELLILGKYFLVQNHWEDPGQNTADAYLFSLENDMSVINTVMLCREENPSGKIFLELDDLSILENEVMPGIIEALYKMVDGFIVSTNIAKQALIYMLEIPKEEQDRIYVALVDVSSGLRIRENVPGISFHGTHSFAAMSRVLDLYTLYTSQQPSLFSDRWQHIYVDNENLYGMEEAEKIIIRNRIQSLDLQFEHNNTTVSVFLGTPKISIDNSLIETVLEDSHPLVQKIGANPELVEYKERYLYNMDDIADMFEKINNALNTPSPIGQWVYNKNEDRVKEIGLYISNRI